MAEWHHQLDDMSLSELRELVMDKEAWRAAIHGVAKSWWKGSNSILCPHILFLQGVQTHLEILFHPQNSHLGQRVL